MEVSSLCWVLCSLLLVKGNLLQFLPIANSANCSVSPTRASAGSGMDAVCPALAMFSFIVGFFLDFGFKSSSL